MGAWHIIMFVDMSILALTVWTLDKVAFKVIVTRNGISIPWDKNLADGESSKFKQIAMAVELEVTKDLAQLQGIHEINVIKFMQNHGCTSCEFECKINSTVVAHKDIEEALNETIDIGSYNWIQMSLQLLSEPWIGAYNDPNSLKYRNLTTRIIAALSKVYKGIDYVVDFEITSLSRAPRGPVVVEYLVLVNSETELKKAHLDEIFNEFTKNNSFGGMIIGKRAARDSKSEDTQKPDGYVIVLVVIGASVMGLVIIAFLVRVLQQTCRPKVNQAPEERLKAHRRESTTSSVTALEKNNIDSAFVAIDRNAKTALLEGSNLGLLGCGMGLKIEAGRPEI